MSTKDQVKAAEHGIDSENGHRHCAHTTLDHENMGWSCDFWPVGGPCCKSKEISEGQTRVMSTKTNKPRGMRAADWRGDRKAPEYHPVVEEIVEMIHELRVRVQDLRGDKAEQLAGALQRMYASAAIEDVDGPDPTQYCVLYDADIAELLLQVMLDQPWNDRVKDRWRDGVARETESRRMSDAEFKALSALASNGTGSMTSLFWREEHGASRKIRRRLQKKGFVRWDAPFWTITSEGLSAINELQGSAP